MKEEDPDVARVEEIVVDYLTTAEQGQAQEVDALLSRHPDLEAPLRERFAALGRLDDCLARMRRLVPMNAQDPIPSIPGFRIFEYLGQGGMGVVYLAEQLSLKRLVALKVLAPFWMNDPRAVERFQREAETIARLSHSGIVSIHQFGSEGGTLYLSIDFIPGMDLAALIARLREANVPPSGAEVLRLIRESTERSVALAEKHGARVLLAQEDSAFWERSYTDICAVIIMEVAKALEVAHSNRILHRDVKPSNIILGLDGLPRLIDFGLTMSDTAASLTRPAEFIGSAPYCSPEQIAGGAHELSAASEVFSLGSVLYELLSLRRPFDGKTLPEIFAKVEKAKPARLRLIAPWVPPPLENICHTALDRSLARRYPTAKAFADDFQRFLTGTPVRARAVWRRRLAAQTCATAVSIFLLGIVVWRAKSPKPDAAPRQTSVPVPAVSTVPLSSKEPSRELAADPEDHKAKGYALFLFKRYPEAALRLAKAIESAPTDLKTRLYYAEALRQSGNLGEAEKQYALCATLAPRNSNVLQGYAATLAQNGDLNAAVRQYKKSLDVSSEDARTHLLIGELLSSLQRDEEATYYYARAEMLALNEEDRRAAKEGLADTKSDR